MSKPKSIQIDIPNPCSQSWDAMLPDATGRHCSHCRKSIIDFTTWNDAALYNFFSQNDGHVCGRFLSTQVGHPIHIPYQPHSKLYRLAAALGLTLIFTQTPAALAQNRPPKTEQSSLIKQADSTGNQPGEISGRVLDDENEPLPNATLQVYKNGVLTGGNITDWNGNYTIQSLAPGNYDILVLYLGYDSVIMKSVTVNEHHVTTQNFQLKRNSNHLTDVHVITGYEEPLIDKNRVIQESVKATPISNSVINNLLKQAMNKR